MPLSIEAMALRLLTATALAALIGFERERHERAAGLRTHALVGLGACLFMLTSMLGFREVLGPHVTLDPSRVAAQVVTGVGFLGAGTIVIGRRTVRGLTTAASIWTVAAIGLAVGGGLYVPALMSAVLALIVLLVLRWLETRVEGRRTSLLVAEFDPREVPVLEIVSAVERAGLQFKNIRVEAADESDKRRIEISTRAADGNVLAAVERLTALPGVREAHTGKAPRR